MKAIIIDNDSSVRFALKAILEQVCPDVTIEADAAGVADGIEAIARHRPDVVFLDVELADGKGTEILQTLSGLAFQTVFVTAFPTYAVDAFKVEAIDFILKPILPGDVVRAVERVRQKAQPKDGHSRTILLRDAETVHVVPVRAIVLCSAHGVYTEFHRLGQAPLLMSRNLKEYESQLSPFGFVRVHHSHLVNLEHVKAFDKRNGGVLVMSDGHMVTVSHRKRESVLAALDAMSV
jgi:two-component system LytT family response regulator